jgi:hypothetical protein
MDGRLIPWFGLDVLGLVVVSKFRSYNDQISGVCLMAMYDHQLNWLMMTLIVYSIHTTPSTIIHINVITIGINPSKNKITAFELEDVFL